MRQCANVILMLVLLVFGCRKEDYSDLGIELVADVTAEKTTHTFTFSVITDRKMTPGEKIYCRYDWEGDGIWDTQLTEDLEIHHRYYAPGLYIFRAEILSQSAVLNQDSLEILVKQGQSKPKADFSVHPGSGNFMTDFYFDASTTTDDEDSLQNLRFRWDIYDDGVFETQSLADPYYTYQFKKAGIYPVRLEVKDPSGLFSSVAKEVRIHTTDSLIHPIISVLPQNGSVVDTFLFDGSLSFHESGIQKLFSYQWKFDDQPETDWAATNVTTSHVFETQGLHTASLSIRDLSGLQNKVDTSFYVGEGNRPPEAWFETQHPYGNLSTQFYFYSLGSHDDHTAGSKLLRRWDFEGDGIWDSPFDELYETYHQYNQPGIYQPTLQVKDEEGLTGSFSIDIHVSSSTRPTGMIRDKRDQKLYPTVKIGNYWWMGKNLDWRIDNKMGIPMLQKCVNDIEVNCDKYGSLYQFDYLQDYLSKGRQICPDGWRVPGKDEIINLTENLPANESTKALEPGGSMDFNLQYSGYGDYHFIYDLLGNVADTVWNYYRQDELTYVPSTYMVGGDKIYGIHALRENPDTRTGFIYGVRYYLPIRCVKD